MDVGMIFPGGGALWDFTKLFLWEGKCGQICFFPLEIKKTTFFAENFKIKWGVPPPLPTLVFAFLLQTNGNLN